ncbi:hypothetical protein LOK49_LG05G02890 [Camellia lanceoleosa]|uniref:Uncharacterized protein n=1 Tax=Camellia lanceoleosa TaxID=1840588 RepID=A0ACC0HNS2_9ERIC|nr:hypothetical protein LOK49_LG05G02890 [Camellia lanceoleosa]
MWTMRGKAEDQLSWRVLQNEKLAGLREKLQSRREQYPQGKAKVEKMSFDLKVKYELLESAMTTVTDFSFALFGKKSCRTTGKVLPYLIYTQSLGHMAITSERLHKLSVVIKQICKLFPQRRVNIDRERKDGSSGQYDQICNAHLPRGLDPHSIPSEELAASLGSSKQVQQLNKSAWNVNSVISSSTLLESAHALPITRNALKNNLQSSAASFPYATDSSDIGKNENLIEGWDLVEHPTFPPPPSQTEDVEHWTRAMFIDATKK